MLISKPSARNALPLFLTATLLSLIPHSTCWGSLGHRTVAYLATHYLTENGTAFTSFLLDGEDISEAALWPDKVRRTREFSFTAGWHFIDAHDNPPEECGVKLSRDCSLKASCVVSAIANQTKRITNPATTHADQGEALRFLLHFFGDIHQPLHTEAEGRGGNDIEVLFGSKKTNLHAIWDTDILVKHTGHVEDELETAQTFAKQLFAKDRHPAASLGAECHDLDKAADCALATANEVNHWICKYVLKDDVAGVRDKDLSGPYFEKAVPIVEELLGKAGRRLAAWVNALADQALENASDILVESATVPEDL